jgi:alpha-beta hydrolase superfamily lysophospholipase
MDDARCCLQWLLQRYACPSGYVLGMSWGGKLAAAMHVDNPRNIAGLVLITPGLFPIIDVSPAEKFRIGWSMVSNPTKHYDIPLNNPELFTRTPEWMEYLRTDELQLHQATAGFFLASRRLDKIFKRLASAPPVPLHLMLASDEKIIDNGQTIDFIRGIPWPHRVITQYERSRHTLEFDPDRDVFLEDLVRWLNDPTHYDGLMAAETVKHSS